MKTLRKLAIVAAWAVVLLPAVAANAGAFAPTTDLWGGQQAAVNAGIGLTNNSPQVIVARIINVTLGFLGIIAVVIIVAGGFKWMTSGGSEDKIGEAKKLMAAGVIGLIIILASWGISRFVISSISNATMST
ncbi:hypothetical protein HGA34_03005 [Candidatus Falkowbacteria bacterium]|nr:hypothetical protein [Candidatus Falkowbacteria bacterium]